MDANQIISIFDGEKYINLSVLNNEDVMIESYELWIDEELSCYCMQELYLYNSNIEQIGDTVS